jgi:hypothetical protein
VAGIRRSAFKGWLPAPRRCSPRQAEHSVSQQDRPGGYLPGLLSEASLHGSSGTRRCQHAAQGVDTPARVGSRQHLYLTRSASVFGGALASCDGSDLLPLKLPLLCSQATPFVAPPELRRFRGLCQARFLHLPPSPLRVPFASGDLSANSCLSSPPRPGRRCRFAVATLTFPVTALIPPAETTGGNSLGQPAASNCRQPRCSPCRRTARCDPGRGNR